MAQSVADFFAAHVPVVYEHIGLGELQHKKVYDQYVSVGKSDSQYQDTAIWGGPGFLDRHLENEPITPKKIVNQATFRHSAVFYAGLLTASKESFIGGGSNTGVSKVKKMAESMGRAAQTTPDLVMALFMDRAFTDNSIYDGGPLYSTTHPLPQGGTESNMSSDALSHAGLETMFIALSQLKGLDGNPQAYEPEAIMVAPAKWPLLDTLLSTPKRTGGLFNDTSFVYKEGKGLKPAVNRFLQNTTFWHVVTEVTTKQKDGTFLDWLEGINYERDNVTNTRQLLFVAAEGFLFGARGWHGNWGSNSSL